MLSSPHPPPVPREQGPIAHPGPAPGRASCPSDPVRVPHAPRSPSAPAAAEVGSRGGACQGAPSPLYTHPAPKHSEEHLVIRMANVSGEAQVASLKEIKKINK